MTFPTISFLESLLGFSGTTAPFSIGRKINISPAIEIGVYEPQKCHLYGDCERTISHF